MYHCDGCGSDKAHKVRTKIHPDTLEKLEWCNECSDIGSGGVGIPDVYIGSKGGLQTDMNLHDPKTGRPIPFSTKREKAAIMKQLGLKQANNAERHHGARNLSPNARYHSV